MTPAAGWYDDPWDADRYRYWDGTRWTAHASPKYASAPRAERAGGSAAREQTADGARLSGWWRRAGARILDNLIILVASSPFSAYFVYRYFLANEELFREQFSADANPMSTAFETPVHGLGWSVLATLVVVGVGSAYEGYFLRRWDRTPGKRATGIEIWATDVVRPLPWTTLARRIGVIQGLYLAAALPVVGLLASFALLLDYLWPLWDGKRQALHDKVADTIVVRR